jgi:hypothetical protein
MNTLHSFKYFFFLFLLAAVDILPQATVNINWDAKDAVVRFINQQSQYDYTYTTSPNIGRKDGANGIHSGSTEDIFRSEFRFPLSSVPSNATIISVGLFVNVSNSFSFQYNLKITKTNYGYSYGQQWSEIGNGSILLQNISYTQSGDQRLTSQELLNAFNAAKSSGYLSIGSLSQSEGTNNTHADVNLTLSVEYTVPPTNVSITADNNFTAPGGANHGTIKVDGNTQTAPYNFSRNTGVNVSLQALRQNDNQSYVRDWNNGYPNFRSKWERIVGPSTTDKGDANPYGFTTATDDDGATYKANLRKRYQIYRNDQTEFDGTISAGFQTEIFEQNSGQISAPTTKTVNGKLYNFAGWTDGDISNPRSITPTGNTTLIAFYKRVNYSNTSTSFSNNNQRKIVKAGGTLYKVYESSNHIWLEKSLDGNSWELVGGSVDNLNDGPEAKNPSIDYADSPFDVANPYNLYITYQQKTTDGKYKVKLVKYNSGGNKIFSYDVQTSLNNYSEEATPVVSAAQCYSSSLQRNKIIVVWKENSNGSLTGGLYYRGCLDQGTSVSWNYTPQKISFTSNSNSNPTIDVIKDNLGTSYAPTFHLAYQYLDTKIKYCRIGYGSGVSVIGSEEEPSYGSGITKNFKPSITVINSYSVPYYSYDSPKLTWLASFGSQDFFVQFRDKNNSMSGTPWNSFYSYYSPDYPMNSVNINKTIEDDYFAFVYSEGSYNKYVKSTNLSYVHSLSTSVANLQISNSQSWDWEGMDIIAFNSTSYPYLFSKAATILRKENNYDIAEGRAGSVIKDDGEFYFSFSDVKNNGNIIEFIEKNDSVNILNNITLNKYLETKPFLISDNSTLTYMLTYWVNDSLIVKKILGNGGFLNFKIELIDNKTNEVLAVINDITQTVESISIKKNMMYKVNLSHLGNREAKLRMIETDNIKGAYSFSKVFTSTYQLNKNNINEIFLSDGSVITEYNLFQNYPNPFNPSTQIKYSILAEGLVTLKIYDVLGKEIAVLVNEYKNAGNYSTTFDASDLASGVYVYQLHVNDFVATKKLVLLK